MSGRTTPRILPLAVCLVGWLACSGSPSPGGATSGNAGSGAPAGTAGDGGAAGSTGAGQAGTVGGTGQAGAAASGASGSIGSAGVTGAGGSIISVTAGASGSAGTGGGAAGAAGTGAAGTGAAGSGSAGSGSDAGDTPPWRPLNVTATPGLHSHGQNAALDNRAKPLGKLAVNLGVSGAGFSLWLAKRGYHSVGASFPACAAPNLGAGRDAVGTCRLGMEWKAVSDSVTATVKGLAAAGAPGEDWGYFLTQDGASVRWSDVAFTGVSHGATTAAIIGRLGARVWRVVSCAGPRDNTCGKGPFSLPYDPAKPPFDTACPDSDVASWLDMPTMTPMDRFYVIDGVGDGEYGDIMFNVQRTMYPGVPVQFDVAGAVLTGTNRFIAMGGGHLDFLNAADSVKPLNTDAVLNIAFAIPAANQNPTF